MIEAGGHRSRTSPRRDRPPVRRNRTIRPPPFRAAHTPIRRWRGDPPQGRIQLSVNGQIRQDAVVADMLWNVAEIISEASKLWRLEAGDLIYTGTPEGVGPLVRGDRVTGEVEGVGRLEFKVS